MTDYLGKLFILSTRILKTKILFTNEADKLRNVVFQNRWVNFLSAFVILILWSKHIKNELQMYFLQ